MRCCSSAIFILLLVLCGVLKITSIAPSAALHAVDHNDNTAADSSSQHPDEKLRVIASSEADDREKRPTAKGHSGRKRSSGTSKADGGVLAAVTSIPKRLKSRRKLKVENIPKIDAEVFKILFVEANLSQNSTSSSNSSDTAENAAGSQQKNRLTNEVYNPLMLMIQELRRLFSSYSFQGIGFGVYKSLTVWNSVTCYCRLPITANFPVYDSVLQLPKISISFGFSYPFALRCSASASVPLQTIISLIAILNAIISETYAATAYETEKIQVADIVGNATETGLEGLESSSSSTRSYFRNNNRLMLFPPYLATTKSAWRYSMSLSYKYSRKDGLIRYLSPQVSLTPGLHFTQGVKPAFTLLSTIMMVMGRIIKKGIFTIREGVTWTIVLACIRIINAMGRVLGVEILRTFGRDNFEEVIIDDGEELLDTDEIHGSTEELFHKVEKKRKKKTTLRRKKSKSKKKKKKSSINIQDDVDMTDFETYVAKSADEVESGNSIIGLLAFGKTWRRMSYFFSRKFPRLWTSSGVSFMHPPGRLFWGSAGFELSPFFPLGGLLARYYKPQFSSFGAQTDVADKKLINTDIEKEEHMRSSNSTSASEDSNSAKDSSSETVRSHRRKEKSDSKQKTSV